MEVSIHTINGSFTGNVPDNRVGEAIDLLSRGGLIFLNNGRLVFQQPKPNNYSVLNEKYRWVIDETLYANELAKLKDSLWEEIKNVRLFKNTDGCFIASINKWIHTDEISQISYSRAKEYLHKHLNTQIEWKMLDNSFVKVNSEIMDSFTSSIFLASQQIFKEAEIHRMKIYQEVSIANLLEYDIHSNWSKTWSDIEE